MGTVGLEGQIISTKTEARKVIRQGDAKRDNDVLRVVPIQQFGGDSPGVNFMCSQCFRGKPPGLFNILSLPNISLLEKTFIFFKRS